MTLLKLAGPLSAARLPSGERDIGRFDAAHTPLAGEIRVEDAPYWISAQARLLREELVENADGAPVIDPPKAALCDG